MNTAEILRAAKAVILQQRWCQHSAELDDKFCALGAINHVCAGDWVGYCEASNQVRNVLNLQYGVACWNDDPWQTAEGVAKGFELAAESWEAEHPDQVAPPVVWTARERVLA